MVGATGSTQMLYTAVAADQFEVTRNEVRHKPTGASFTSYPGLDKVICGVKWGSCGRVLPSGESYSCDEVEAMAKVLIAGQAIDPTDGFVR
jgi:hypothetical protein